MVDRNGDGLAEVEFVWKQVWKAENDGTLSRKSKESNWPLYVSDGSSAGICLAPLDTIIDDLGLGVVLRLILIREFCGVAIPSFVQGYEKTTQVRGLDISDIRFSYFRNVFSLSSDRIKNPNGRNSLATAHILEATLIHMVNDKRYELSLPPCSSPELLFSNSYFGSNAPKTYLRMLTSTRQTIPSTIEIDQANIFSEDRNIHGRVISALQLSVTSVLCQINDFKAEITADNYLAVEHEQFHKNLLSFLHSTSTELSKLNTLVSTSVGTEEKKLEIVRDSGFVKQYWENLADSLRFHTSPEAVAKVTFPMGIILGFGTIGALIGGPIGFASGSLLGQFALGHAKPNELAKKVEEHMKNGSDGTGI